MTLIRCPECGKEVSDKSKVCIHCGYPLVNLECVINGKVYDLSDAMTTLLSGDILIGIKQIREKTFLGLSDAKALADEIRSTKKIPKKFIPEFPPKTQEEILNTVKQQTITCPYCKSTDVKKITVTSKAIHTAAFGIFSIGRNSKQWHCNNCKSDF